MLPRVSDVGTALAPRGNRGASPTVIPTVRASAFPGPSSFEIHKRLNTLGLFRKMVINKHISTFLPPRNGDGERRRDLWRSVLDMLGRLAAWVQGVGYEGKVRHGVLQKRGDQDWRYISARNWVNPHGESVDSLRHR